MDLILNKVFQRKDNIFLKLSKMLSAMLHFLVAGSSTFPDTTQWK